MNPNIYYKWSKEFLEAGKKRLQGDTAREATSTEVVDLKKENDQLKALVAELSLKNRVLKKSLKGGLIVIGGLNLGGGIDPVYNAVNVAELAIEKGATTLLIPISARRQLNELSDDMAMKISILFYADSKEALLKALSD